MKVMFVDWYYIGAENNPRNCLANLHWTPSVSVVKLNPVDDPASKINSISILIPLYGRFM